MQGVPRSVGEREEEEQEKKMTRILQGNMGARRGAADLKQILLENRVDIMLACERYIRSNRPDDSGWLIDKDNDAHI